MCSLLYVAYLVQLKNDLNRKRRRFYSIMNPGVKRTKYGLVGSQSSVWSERQRHEAYSGVEARKGYRKAQADMKQLTPIMRQARIEAGVRYCWDDRGAIHSITHDGKRYFEKDIKRLAEAYDLEQILRNS